MVFISYMSSNFIGLSNNLQINHEGPYFEVGQHKIMYISTMSFKIYSKYVLSTQF